MLLDLSTQMDAADYRRAQITEEFRRVGAGARDANRHPARRTGLAGRLQRLLHRRDALPQDRVVRHSASPDPAR